MRPAPLGTTWFTLDAYSAATEVPKRLADEAGPEAAKPNTPTRIRVNIKLPCICQLEFAPKALGLHSKQGCESVRAGSVTVSAAVCHCSASSDHQESGPETALLTEPWHTLKTRTESAWALPHSFVHADSATDPYARDDRGPH